VRKASEAIVRKSEEKMKFHTHGYIFLLGMVVEVVAYD
jgi:hypothetical protein